MKLFSKAEGKEVGGIDLGLGHDKRKILEEFQNKTSPPENDDLKFRGDLDGQHLAITMKRGSWCIMESMIPHILSYVPGDIIEIGMGESTEILAQAAKSAGVNLYSCDIQMGGMFNVFDKPLFENHQCFTDGSDDFMEQYGGSPSIVFIDGEHIYETVKKEVGFFLPKMRPGGVMFLHDTMPLFKRNISPDSKGYNPGIYTKCGKNLSVIQNTMCLHGLIQHKIKDLQWLWHMTNTDLIGGRTAGLNDKLVLYDVQKGRICAGDCSAISCTGLCGGKRICNF